MSFLSHDSSRSLLWRNRDFRLLWAGHTISTVGSQITIVALPLIAALTLQATPAQMAFLVSLQYAPATLLSLFAGVLVDRMRRRPLMIITDLLSALLLLTIPLAVMGGWLRIELLDVVAFLLGGVGVFYGLADGAFLPVLVGRAQLPQANSALATSGSAARVVGPSVAALLVQWVTTPFAVLIDAVTFLISALSAALIRTPEPAVPVQKRQSNLWQEMSTGLRVIADNPYLRTFALSSAGLDIFWNALYAVYVLYITRVLVLPPATVGLILSAGSITALASAPIAAAIARRFGLGRTLIMSHVLVSSGSLLIVLAMFLRPAALVFLISAEAMQVCANTIFWINRDSVRQAITPDHVRGRVGAATMCIGLGVALLGTLLGGVLGEYVGIPTTIIVGAIGGMCSFLWLVFSPVRHLYTIEDVAV